MSIAFPFSGVARSFLDQLNQTRRSMADTAQRVALDAKNAHSWGFFALGTVAHKLLGRQSDAEADHNHDIRSVAERAVWLTHFMNDPHAIHEAKQQIVEDNGGTVTMSELNGYLAEHLDELPLHGASPEQRTNMLNDMRSQGVTPAPTHEI